MSINWKQFEQAVLRPWCPPFRTNEPSVAPKNHREVEIRLVGETIWHESNRLRALGQYPWDPKNDTFGPGLGIASIERPTWDWMKTTPEGSLYLREYAYEQLAWDLRLNVIACRIRYRIDARNLPKLEDGIEARAGYWFMVYNGSGVVTRRDDYIRNAEAIPWPKN